jgi:hypothetical protein
MVGKRFRNHSPAARVACSRLPGGRCHAIGLLLCLLIIAGCTSGGQGGGQGRGRRLVTIKPTRPILETPRGGLPEAVPHIIDDCDRGLRAEHYEGVVTKMTSVIQSSQQPQERAIALVCLGIAQANLAQFKEAAGNLGEAERLRTQLPEGSRQDLELLRLRGQMVVQTELGNIEEGRQLLARAVAVAPDQAATVQAEFQQAAATVQPTDQTSPTTSPAPRTTTTLVPTTTPSTIASSASQATGPESPTIAS